MLALVFLAASMHTTKLSKVDLLVFIFAVLAVVAALRLGARVMTVNKKKTGHGNSTTGMDYFHRGHGQVMNRAGSQYHGTHDGHADDSNDHGTGYPFFWYFEETGSPEMFTVWHSVEEELKLFAQQASNSPSITSKENQVENDIALSDGVGNVTL